MSVSADATEVGPPGDLQAELPQAILADFRPTPTHCGISVPSLYGWLLPSLLPLLLAGALFFGWRALATAGLTLAATMVGVGLWRLVGQRGKGLQFSHALLLAGLLSVLLPAELSRSGDSTWSMVNATWPLAIAAGLTLVFFYWLFGGVGARLHPVAVTALLLLTLFSKQMTPGAVLMQPHLFVGDVLKQAAPQVVTGGVARDEMRMFQRLLPSAPPAVALEPVSSTLTEFMKETKRDGAWLSLDSLVRDRLPPLEDLLVGGHPMPLGLASLVAVLVGGLMLLYRGGADWRVPCWTLLSAFVCFLTFRLPVAITSAGPAWRWLAWREPGVEWETVATFAFYQMAAGPLVFVAFFLATDGASTPTSRRGRLVYAVTLGAASAALQLYVGTAQGALLGLLLVSLVSPALDRATRKRPVLGRG